MARHTSDTDDWSMIRRLFLGVMEIILGIGESQKISSVVMDSPCTNVSTETTTPEIAVGENNFKLRLNFVARKGENVFSRKLLGKKTSFLNFSFSLSTTDLSFFTVFLTLQCCEDGVNDIVVDYGVSINCSDKFCCSWRFLLAAVHVLFAFL